MLDKLQKCFAGYQKLHPTFLQHEGEQIITDFSCLGELTL